MFQDIDTHAKLVCTSAQFWVKCTKNKIEENTSNSCINCVASLFRQYKVLQDECGSIFSAMEEIKKLVFISTIMMLVTSDLFFFSVEAMRI